MFVIRKWDTDLYMNMNLTYDVGLEVVDSSGKLLAEAALKGEDVIDKSNRQKPKRATPSAAAVALFEDLLKVNNIRAALSGETPAAATPPNGAPTRTATEAAASSPAKSAAPTVSSTSRSDIKETQRSQSAPTRENPQAAQPERKCSVEQVMKMKDLKISDAQIKAACE